MAFTLTPRNVDDLKPTLRLVKKLFGKFFIDKSYPSYSLATLLEHGLPLIIGIRVNINNHLMLLSDKLMLRKRYIIKSMNNQLKMQSHYLDLNTSV